MNGPSHWDEDADYPVEDWQREVSEGDTREGYREWVVRQRMLATTSLGADVTMKFHKDGTLPTNGEIFVFGSNLGGIHGSGAARVAREKFGAIYFIGVGHTGNSYAVPTKNEDVTSSLPLRVIQRYVDQFIAYARMAEYFWDTNVGLTTPNRDFFVTGVGCGLAGYKPEQIAPMFKDAPDNCSFPDTWKEFLK